MPVTYGPLPSPRNRADGTVALAHPPVVADREKGSARGSESVESVGTHRVCGH
jgi:hypothetical protein